ncbi:hypothetical protein GUJ93_ZPchr0458g22297 [Zizania palustris]|uniref:Uncharacterized protein n=1 Tax=Zizania palustris TaxID=103762 RepID=A0A8J5VEP2_ZIZPA|nr:hypothetical protein GUJ93_ZPchr0458g22297 [Zizania palustris]
MDGDSDEDVLAHLPAHYTNPVVDSMVCGDSVPAQFQDLLTIEMPLARCQQTDLGDDELRRGEEILTQNSSLAIEVVDTVSSVLGVGVVDEEYLGKEYCELKSKESGPSFMGRLRSAEKTESSFVVTAKQIQPRKGIQLKGGKGKKKKDPPVAVRQMEELGSSLSSGRGTKGLRVAPCSNQPLGSGGKKLKKSESSK